MKIEKFITVYADADLKEITLLSEEEYVSCKAYIKPLLDWYWLRSPGDSCRDAKLVNENDSFYVFFNIMTDVRFYVRPALRIGNLGSLNLEAGNFFMLGGYKWTVISDELALCDETVGKTVFKENWTEEESNKYETSDVKKWLEKWAEDHGIIK